MTDSVVFHLQLVSCLSVLVEKIVSKVEQNQNVEVQVYWKLQFLSVKILFQYASLSTDK